MTFQEELEKLVAEGLPFTELRLKMDELFRRHGREVPEPITGTVAAVEPEDSLK
jgi:hypothetical protein